MADSELAVQNQDAAQVQNLKHHFADLEQQKATSTFGMWLLLVTEIMFFGGLFAVYLIYRLFYYNAWVAGSQTMEIQYGTANTMVLICSSLTMVMAVHFAKLGNRKLTTLFLACTRFSAWPFSASRAWNTTRTGCTTNSPGQASTSSTRATTTLARCRCFSRCTLP